MDINKIVLARKKRKKNSKVKVLQKNNFFADIMNSNSIDKFEEKASDQWLSGVEFTKTNGQFNIGKAAEYLPPAVINAILQESNIILLFDLPCAIKAETKEVFRPIMAHDTMPSVYILQHEGLATNGRDTQHFNTRGIKYQWFIFNNGRELKSDETEQASVCCIIFFFLMYVNEDVFLRIFLGTYC